MVTGFSWFDERDGGRGTNEELWELMSVDGGRLMEIDRGSLWGSMEAD